MPVDRIRFATAEDVSAMLDIYAPYVLEQPVSFETKLPTDTEFLGRVQELGRHFPWLVYERDGSVLGYAYAHRFGERAGFDWSAVSSVYVGPAAKGTGLGKALYAALEGLLKAQGYRNLYAMITHPNPVSEGFHEHLGFTLQGMFPEVGYKFGRQVGVGYWAKPLLPTVENPPRPVSVQDLPKETVDAILQI